MQPGRLIGQVSAGAIVGLSAIIYALSYGALLFSGPFSAFIGYGISIALITAIIGALYSWQTDEKTFIAGPDSNTISVVASTLAILGATGTDPLGSLNQSVLFIFTTTLISGGVFYFVARANLAGLLRYIPFAVMAGFLVSTGWLMSSGALNIISGTPLTWQGLQKFLANPAYPELIFGVCVAIALHALSTRVPTALLIPMVMFISALAVNAMLASGLCSGAHCDPSAWLFAAVPEIQWLPPWQLSLSYSSVGQLLEQLPSMLAVSFVGLLTVLLSIASLELSYQREFDLNRALKAHALAAGVSATLGGFLGLISIGRTTLNRQAGGGAVAGLIASLLCLAALVGAGQIITYLPKAGLGGLVLYLGGNMIKQWLWDQRRNMTKVELAQIVLILVLVANYGFVIGFLAGIAISCIVFVVAYSRIPLIDMATNLAQFSSAVIRSDQENELLQQHGCRTRIYRLSGYVFFGSANRIDALFRQEDNSLEGIVLDFSKVTGIDSSAISVFQRILRRYIDRSVGLYFVCNSRNEASVRAITRSWDKDHIKWFSSLDNAMEAAEDSILQQSSHSGKDEGPFSFLNCISDESKLRECCVFQHISAGEVLCAEGDQSREIYFIESGGLEVVKSTASESGIRIAKLHANAMAGELAFYTGEARSASIIAVVDSTIFVLHRDALTRLRTENPTLAMRFDQLVVQRIARSLVRANSLVALLH